MLVLSTRMITGANSALLLCHLLLHAQEVQRKQRLASSLRVELARQEAAVSSLCRQVDAMPGHYCSRRKRWVDPDGKDVLECQLSTARGNVSSLRGGLREAERAPPPVIQPLPASSTAAQVWVCLLHAPPRLLHLSRAGFLAQQQLLPSPQHAQGVDVSVEQLSTSLLSHYNTHQQPSTFLQSPTVHKGSLGCVKLRSSSKVPDRVGSDHVDSLRSRCVLEVLLLTRQGDLVALAQLEGGHLQFNVDLILGMLRPTQCVLLSCVLLSACGAFSHARAQVM